MVNAPIWKDTFYNVSYVNSPYEYSIVMKDEQVIGSTAVTNYVTVFNGKAWARPGDEYIRININKIAQDYLYSDLPDLRNITSATTYDNKYAVRQFYLVSNNTTAETFNFLLDWSYENTGITAGSLSAPINNHFVPGMFLLSTSINSSLNVTTSIIISRGSSSSTTCGRYALYYLNRYGGWDCFLIEGEVVKTDTYKRYQIGRAYDNTTLDFQKRTYDNEITDKYKLVTGWLSDSESKILAKHLLSSNQVYLHDLVNGDIMPVNITDNNATYKTYKNTGRKRVNYTVNVECSQIKHIIG